MALGVGPYRLPSLSTALTFLGSPAPEPWPDVHSAAGHCAALEARFLRRQGCVDAKGLGNLAHPFIGAGEEQRGFAEGSRAQRIGRGLEPAGESALHLTELLPA